VEISVKYLLNALDTVDRNLGKGFS